ncbi:MAG TPA: class I SAM-dependent methyltransferase [Rhizomicrobium sp.]
MSARPSSPVVALHAPERAVAAAYNQAGDKYLAYADGDPRRLYAFDGQYAYGDRMIWETLFAKLCAIRAGGARSIRILDLGCGPGTWLRRVVTRARAIGFDSVAARGFDIAGDQVKRARALSTDLAGLPGVTLSFEVGDIFAPLAEADASVDLTLCLCGVLNHLPAADLPPVFAEIARATRGSFVTTARTVGSTPSVYVEALPQARRFRQDNRLNRLDVEFHNGRRMSLPSHLFGAAELRTLAAPCLAIEDLCGLDLFHGRFAGDPRWNPDCEGSEGFVKRLEQLEKAHCRDPLFLDHATHLLLVAKPRAREAVS